jgi:hypothetical protein
MFNQQGFVYTLSPPLLGKHGIDEFLFDTRSGFCEHYASAFVVLMRAAGIPARVVTGYLGGEINPISDYLIVRQADAHAWAEIWLDRDGWVRVDPTAAVAPARIAQGAGAAIDVTSVFGRFVRGDLPGLRHLRLAWDSVASSWNDKVLGHAFERQRSLLTQASFDGANRRTLAAALFVAMALLMLAFALTLLQRWRARARDPLAFAHATFCLKLARAGLPRERHEGPIEYAERVSRALPHLDVPVRHFFTLYADLRYGPRPDAAGVAALQRLARDFNPRAAPAQARAARTARDPLSNLR